MTTGPEDVRDERFDEAWRRASVEEPPRALDDAIRAAARREIGTRPRDVASVPEATSPERWWFPLAAAAVIGLVAIGLLQLSTPERVAPEERQAVSDMPAGAKSMPAQPAAPAASSPSAKAESKPSPAARQREARDEAQTRTAPAAMPSVAGALPTAPAAPPKLAAEVADASSDALAMKRATMPAAEWIALMRRLKDEGRGDELAKELAAFRKAHADADALLPPELRALPAR